MMNMLRKLNVIQAHKIPIQYKLLEVAAKEKLSLLIHQNLMF